MLNFHIAILILLGWLLPACNQLGSLAQDPPLPTIVATTAASSQPTPTPTAQPLAAAVDEQPAQAEAVSSPTPMALPTSTGPPTATPVAIERPPLEAVSLELIPVVSDLTKPLYLTHAGDGAGRLFIVEQAGRILILERGQIEPTPFLDIVSIVGSDANEQGLLSLAFHPNYQENGFFFINYTDTQGDTVIARYQVSTDPKRANRDSAKILLTIPQPYRNHNGGQVEFGPDGYLYVGMGDGGAANDPQNRAQDLSTLLGKLLRIDIDRGEPYGVPADNPFVNSEQARPEIWSYGWRNPWRFSFDSASGDLYIADVGQNQYEEVHVEPAGVDGGQNYGWRLMEGLHCFNPRSCDPATLGVMLPVAEYDHGSGCSITGGYVYQGEQYPALKGTYFYGDYCTGLIWGLRREADGGWAQAELLRSDRTISSFGRDEADEIYVVDHQGTILRLSQSLD